MLKKEIYNNNKILIEYDDIDNKFTIEALSDESYEEANDIYINSRINNLFIYDNEYQRLLDFYTMIGNILTEFKKKIEK